MKIKLNTILNVLLAGLILYHVGRYFYLRPDVASGEKAPAFSAQLIDGQQVDLVELQGNLVLLDFWGSWCGPCRRQNPKLVRLHEEYGGKRLAGGGEFHIVSIALERDAARWRQAIEEDGLAWKYHILDGATGGDPFNGSIADLYGVKSIPASFLLDEKGTIIGVNLSPARIGRILAGRL